MLQGLLLFDVEVSQANESGPAETTLLIQSSTLYDDSSDTMSTLNQVILTDKDQNGEKNLDWNYIEWLENEMANTGVANAHTQTEHVSTLDQESQTSSPVIMHIDLTRTHPKLRGAAPAEAEGLAPAPMFQFDRQALGRISTSPTLRRMRSTRRSQTDFPDPIRLESTREEPGVGPALHQPPISPLCDGMIHHDNGPAPTSTTGRQRTRSHRSKTFDNCITYATQESLSSHQNVGSFEFPECEVQENEPAHNRLQERRRSSVVVSIPGLDVSPGDLFVSNGAADLLNRSSFSDTKKSKWPFLRRNTTKAKILAHTPVSDVEKWLSTAQIQDWRNTVFQKYKDCSLAEFLQDESPRLKAPSDPQGYKRQEAIWELFTSESVYFLDQLMVLKEVFLATLTSLQTRNCLSDLDPWRLFANLNELCQASFSILNDLLRAIKDTLECPAEVGGATLPGLLSKAFEESICHRLQKYCLNYAAALLYLDGLKHREDFGCYLKWCEGNQECRRLQLRDLLVAPLQRLTRYPLLLRNVARRCPGEEEEEGDGEEGGERAALLAVAEQVDTSICDLEGKVKWLDNYQKVKRLRDALVWLPVWERNKRTFVPESLKHLLKTVTLENLISHSSLLHDGKLVATENAKMVDVYLFLFDEFLLITKMKRSKKRSVGPEQAQNLELEQFLKEGCTFTVVDQPVSLDRLQLKSIDQLNAAASGLPHSFIIMHQNRYQQCICAFILQAPCEAVKKVWMLKIEGAVTELLKQDSQQPRVKCASLWLESLQI